MQVFATGYKFAFPFLASHVVSVSENKVALYKYVFPPEMDRHTLAIIGLVQPLGAIMPISEMQARWATRVFKGIRGSLTFSFHLALYRIVLQFLQTRQNNCVLFQTGCIKLPSVETMLKDIQCKKDDMAKRYWSEFTQDL